MKKISIYGIGNFGYAVLKHLDKKNGGDFILHAYDRNPQLVDFLNSKREHLFLHKGQKVSDGIIFDNKVKNLLENCDILILAVTSNAVKEVVREIKECINKKIIIINTAKALDWDTGKRISEIIKNELREKSYEYVLLSGGTIAKDLFDHEPLGATLACENKKVLKEAEQLFESDNLFIYPSDDVAGTEYASAFKNVISILAGITKGLGFSYGAETHIISRAAAEVQSLVIKKHGGKKKTFEMGSQCWGNDLWMSCTGNTRNREFGILVGQGIGIKKALTDMKNRNKTVEGINTIMILNKIEGINDCYILNLVFKLFTGKSSLDEFKDLIFKNNS
jgi:glycerol-3-phosphate dehydrogenase (NAD(P)+)